MSSTKSKGKGGSAVIFHNVVSPTPKLMTQNEMRKLMLSTTLVVLTLRRVWLGCCPYGKFYKVVTKTFLKILNK